MTASPWREAYGLAKHLAREQFHLTICALRPDGIDEASPLLAQLGVPCTVARFRPRGRRFRHLIGVLRDLGLLRKLGPFDVQHSMDFTPSPIEALLARKEARRFVFTQRNMNENGSRLMLATKLGLAKRTACVSDAVLYYAMTLGRCVSLTRIYPGVHHDSIPLKCSCPEGRELLRVIMVGHVSRRKRIEDGIRALHSLSRTTADVELQIVGSLQDSAYCAEIQELVHATQA